MARGVTRGLVRGRGFAEQLAGALGEGWIVEVRQAAGEGTVPHAAVRRADGPLRLLVEDLDVFVAVTLLPFAKGHDWQFRSAAEVEDQAPAIAAAVAAGGTVPDAITNVADAAWRIAAALETMIPVPGGAWDFSLTSVAYPPVYGSVNLVGGRGWQGIVTAAPRPDGVTIEIPRTDVVLPAATPADVRAHLPDVARAILVRFEHRRVHHQAVLRVKAAAEAVLEALRKDVAPPAGQWSVQLDGAFESRPAAHVMARGGDYTETFVTLDEAGEQPGRPRIKTRDIHERRVEVIERIVATDGELATAIQEAAAAVRWWTGRLSAQRIVPGQAYRLLRPLADLPAGGRIVFSGREHIPREGWARYTFASSSTGRGDLVLDEGYDPDAAILRDLDLYLEPA